MEVSSLSWKSVQAVSINWRVFLKGFEVPSEVVMLVGYNGPRWLFPQLRSVLDVGVVMIRSLLAGAYMIEHLRVFESLKKIRTNPEGLVTNYSYKNLGC